MSLSLFEYCKNNKLEHLLDEWDETLNAPLTPQDVAYGSLRKVAWKCGKGHSWYAIINNRVRWDNCPFCAGKKASEEYCLETIFPEVAKYWDYSRNEGLSPKNVTPKSTKKVWWLCDEGHSYYTSISAKTMKHVKCPICSNKQVLIGYNDLSTTNPDLVKEWDYEKNDILPTEVTAGTKRKVWWKCIEGHNFEQSIGARTRGAGCPFCSGLRVTNKNSLAACNERVALLWDYEKNYPLTPNDVAVKSGKHVFWKCDKGHSWNATISDLTFQDLGCPYCSGKRASENNNLELLFPQILKEWDYNKNRLKPSEITLHSNKKVWWVCEKGHSWEATVNNRVNGNGCPLCNNKSTSFPEQAILFYCRKAFKNALSRDTEAIGKELDVYLKDDNIAIEYDGTRWHQGEDKQRIEREKELLCVKNGIKLFRIIETGVKHDHLETVQCIYLKKNDKRSLEWAIRELLIKLGVADRVDVDLKRDQSAILQEYVSERVEDSIAFKNPEIAKQWDYEKNGTLTPKMFSTGSSYKAWWKCELGHSWKAEIGSRVTGRGCPYCSKKIVSDDYNLEVLYPDKAKEWDYDKNSGLTPKDVMPVSAKIAWWKCPKGHSYQMPINQKTSKSSRCPYCSGRRINNDNSLAALFPDLLSEWDYDRNGSVLPTEIGKGSAKKIWWKCPKGHKYQMVVRNRTGQKQGCPFCAGKKIDDTNSLATKFPDLLKEWDYEKNTVEPTKIAPFSGKKAWWKCCKGHSFEALISNRAKGSKCPYCSGKRARKVRNIDTGEIYENILEAADRIGCSKSSVISACRAHKTAKGWHLEYVE